MIKLKKLFEAPIHVQLPKGIKSKEDEKELINKGFQIKGKNTGDITGQFSNVEYLPDWTEMLGQLQKMRKFNLPWKYANDINIKEAASIANLLLKKAENAIFALSQQVELVQKQSK